MGQELKPQLQWKMVPDGDIILFVGDVKSRTVSHMVFPHL